MNKEESGKVNVTLMVWAEVPIGETVHVSLGQGEVEDEREMFTDPKQFPVWKLELALPRHAVLAYKYLTKAFLRPKQWEPHPGRTLVVSTKLLPVLDYFGVSPPLLGESMVPSTPQVYFRSLAPTLAAASKKICLVAFHIPFKLYLRGRKGEEEMWEAEFDLDNPVATSIGKQFHVKYIGAVTPKTVMLKDNTGGFFNMSPNRIQGITLALNKVNCHPLFLTHALYTKFYVGFCKEVLWDVFHNVLNPQCAIEDTYANGYVVGNQEFAVLAKEHLDGNELVWVHGYHLMLLPKMLDHPAIIFFLHVPFPTSEVFRVLPMREALLDGMLSASTIGFHTFNQARHFLTCCRRLLGAQSRTFGDNGMLAVEYNGLRVLITISHLGVDETRIIETKPSLILAKPPGAQVVFGSLDELQRLKGVSLKLLAFERFLEQNPKWQCGRARFMLWTTFNPLPVTCKRAKDSELCGVEVRKLVQRINAQYGPETVLYLECPSQPDLSFRIALWRVVDVLVSTPVCEGLNLLPLEFALSKRHHPGALVISEFSACSSILNGAVRVGCYDIDRIAKALQVTATMSDAEKLARFTRDEISISTPTSVWAQHVIAEQVNVLEDQHFHYIEPTVAMAVPLNHAFFMPARALPLDQVALAYAQSTRRLILLDLGGTLVELEHHLLSFKKDFLGTLGVGLPEEVEQTLRKLCQDDRNVVFVVSRDTRQVMNRVFYSLLDGDLGLVAHSGLCIRLPKRRSSEDKQEAMDKRELRLRKQTIWEDKVMMEEERHGEVKEEERDAGEAFDAPKLEEWRPTVDVSSAWKVWMESSGIYEILHRYTWSTVGSTCTECELTTSWEYIHCDPEFGLIQARLLIDELELAIANAGLNIAVRHTKTAVDLLPVGVNKGYAVRKIVAMLPALRPSWMGAPADFCLAMGDGSTDEVMFTSVHQLFDALGAKVFTCTVGKKPTTARYFVHRPAAVQALLSELAT
ncbi:trehalose-phosphatase [Batrachochytrium salamandrivorans]|nr:trehalose-phosphatase [Batrachochytrium salamandrivorans]